MIASDASNYSTLTATDSMVEYTGTLWNFGKEIWCNLEGQYTHIVSDMSHLSGQDYQSTICQLGIFGTRYSRQTQVPATLSIEYGTTLTLLVEKIQSELAIGNTLDIRLRQNSKGSHSWVYFTEQSTSTVVTLAPIEISLGDHIVLLESYDNNSSVSSTLKQDLITVTVTAPTPKLTVPSCPVTASEISAL